MSENSHAHGDGCGCGAGISATSTKAATASCCDNQIIQAYTGINSKGKISKAPAWLDFIQSLSGGILGLFMIAHMFLVSSILISREAMQAVAKFLEGSFIIEGGSPIIVSIIAAAIIVILVVHALLAMRKFPINFTQFLKMRTHKHIMKHSDTSLWMIQAGTGFVLFFTATIHLFVMLTQPDTIGPNGSAYRFVGEHFWLLYIVLLFAVELHGSIGLYRLCVKWGIFESLSLNALRKIKWAMSVFFIVLGLATFGAYVKHGLDQSDTTIDYKHYDAIEFGK